MSSLNQQVKAVIVDDESGARETLKSMIRLYCHDVIVVGDADSINSALPLIWKENPDIIFLDVEMPQGSGFDLVGKLKESNSRIIFTTAYSKYALQAIKASAFDYLLKPIDIAELKESIRKSKVSITERKAQQYELLRKLDSRTEDESIKKIAIPSSDGYDIINTEEILFCEGNRNYTSFYLENKRVVVASKTLKEYENMLSDSTFVRVHQKYLVNFDFVTKYIKGRGGILVMKNGKQIPISQNKKAELNKVLTRFLK